MQLFDGAQVFTTEMGGKTLTIETGILGAQAGGAVTVRYGDTVLLATATMSKDVRPEINFFPLTVEFEEKLYAAGRIPGSFFRARRPAQRAGHPVSVAWWTARCARSSPRACATTSQVIVTVLASDGENLMDPLAIIAASAALRDQRHPLEGPDWRPATIGFVDGEFVVNPTAVADGKQQP